MTLEELNAMMGLDTNLVSENATTLTHGVSDTSRHGGRQLAEVARNVDHFADGHMYDVKNQGTCGSCWAFASNSAIEGTMGAKTNSKPERISEQQLVDCTFKYDPANKAKFGKDYGMGGCGGGFMTGAWEFQADQGAMLDEDYPYVSGETR